MSTLQKAFIEENLIRLLNKGFKRLRGQWYLLQNKTILKTCYSKDHGEL